MFEGPTTRGIDLAGPVVVVDLSALYRSAALAMVLACATASFESAWQRATTPTVAVIDEAWAVLSDLSAARFLQSSFKLARAYGLANVAVVHRASDLESAGGAGEHTTRLAEGLLADCETVVCYAQSPVELDATTRLLGLGPKEAALVTRLRRGRALWRVGGRSFLVDHRLSQVERSFVDTDARLREPDHTSAADEDAGGGA
jgi:hypothetical protein